MEQRWGLPLIAWPSRLRPNYWDLVALPMVLGAIALIAWGGLAMSADDLMGNDPRKVYFFPRTGKVLVRMLRTLRNNTILEREASYSHRLNQLPQGGDIELFK